MHRDVIHQGVGWKKPLYIWATWIATQNRGHKKQRLPCSWSCINWSTLHWKWESTPVHNHFINVRCISFYCFQEVEMKVTLSLFVSNYRAWCWIRHILSTLSFAILLAVFGWNIRLLWPGAPLTGSWWIDHPPPTLLSSHPPPTLLSSSPPSPPLFC